MHFISLLISPLYMIGFGLLFLHTLLIQIPRTPLPGYFLRIGTFVAFHFVRVVNNNSSSDAPSSSSSSSSSAMATTSSSRFVDILLWPMRVLVARPLGRAM
jgi:hypothetical protein